MKYEYKKITATISNWNQLLEAGEEGWELVCEGTDFWILKRVEE
jgi:hypothetical protein